MLVEIQAKIKELEDKILLRDNASDQSDLQSHVDDLKKMQNMQLYIELLCKELEEIVPIAFVHGWRSSKYEAGASLRTLIYGNVDLNTIEDDVTS